MIVVDTDVLIDYLRDQPGAVAFLEGCEQPLAASVVSIAELYVGVREGEERLRLDAFVAASVRPQPRQQAGATLNRRNPSNSPFRAEPAAGIVALVGTGVL